MSVNQTLIRESSSSTANNFSNDRAIPKNVTGPKSGIFRATFSKHSVQNDQSEKSAPTAIDTGADSILANKGNSQVVRSQTPSTKQYADFIPKEDVRLLFDEMKQRYHAYKPEESLLKPSSSASVSKNPISTYNSREPLIAGKDRHHGLYSLLNRKAATPGASSAVDWRDNRRQVGAVKPKSALENQVEDRYDISQTYNQSLDNKTVGEYFTSSLSNGQGTFPPKSSTIFNSKSKKENDISTDQILTSSKENNQRVSSQFDRIPETTKILEELRNRNDEAIGTSNKVDRGYPSNLQASSEIRTEDSSSKNPRYNSKRVDDLINSILQRQSTPQAQVTRERDSMKLSVSVSEQGKKPSIFSSSILLRPNKNIETEVSGATENSNQGSQRDHKSLFAARNSHYRKPMTPGAGTKPKNIFSKHLVDDSSKLVKRPHRPQNEIHSKPLVAKSSTDRRQPRDANEQETREVQITEQQDSNKKRHLENGQGEAAGVHYEIEYHCGEIENDEDSFILMLMNKNRTDPEVNKQKDTLDPKESKVLGGTPASVRGRSVARDNKQRFESAEEENSKEFAFSGKILQNQSSKKFEEDVSNSRNQSSPEKMILAYSSHKKHVSPKKESNQQFGTEDYQSDVESGFESNPKAQRQQLSSQQKAHHFEAAYRQEESIEHPEDFAERTKTYESNRKSTHQQPMQAIFEQSLQPKIEFSSEKKKSGVQRSAEKEERNIRGHKPEDNMPNKDTASRNYEEPRQQNLIEEIKALPNPQKLNNPRMGGHKPVGTKGLSSAVFQRNKISQKREENPAPKPQQNPNQDEQRKETTSGYIKGLKTEKPNFKPAVQNRSQGNR